MHFIHGILKRENLTFVQEKYLKMNEMKNNIYEEAKKYCNKVLDNYLEVKDDANYFVLEKDSVDICKKYLEEIKKNS